MGPPSTTAQRGTTPGHSLLASPSARSARAKRPRELTRVQHGATPGTIGVPAFKRQASEPYVAPANLTALRAVVGLCRKRLSDCNYTAGPKDIVGLAKQQNQLEELLARTLLESENNSVLLIGARGAGKSLLTEHVLKVAREKYKRIENEQGESRTTKRKRGTSTKAKTTAATATATAMAVSSATKSSSSSSSSSTSTSTTLYSSTSTKQRSKKRKIIKRAREKSLVQKPRIYFLANDPSRVSNEEQSMLKKELKPSMMKRIHNTRDARSHVVLSSDTPTLSVPLAAVFVQCREALYEGVAAPHIVQRQWLTDSRASGYPVDESNYSMVHACQHRFERRSIANNDQELEEEEEEEEEAQVSAMEERLEEMERHLHLNLDDLFLVTEEDGDQKKLPLDQTFVYIPESNGTVEQLQLLVKASGGTLIDKLPLGTSYETSKHSPAELAYNSATKKYIMVVGNADIICQTKSTPSSSRKKHLANVPEQLLSIGVTNVYPMDTLLRVVLSGEKMFDHSIDCNGQHHYHGGTRDNNSHAARASNASSLTNISSNLPRSPASSHGSDSSRSPQSPQSPLSPEKPSLSAYELARLEQIRENEEALRKLGILSARLGGGPTDLEKEEQARRARDKKQENLMVRERRKERQRRKRIQEEARKSPFMVVRLNGIMHSDEKGEKRALEEISRQMFQDVRLKFSNQISFAQHLRFLFDMLREMKGLDSALVFVLDEFDAFAIGHKKQMLLYTLLDLQQSGEVKMLVIGLTERLDIAEKLEKRVKSRFSHRQIYVPPLMLDDLLRVMTERLQISKDDVKKDKRKKNLTDGVRGTWNQSIDQLFEDRSLQKIIKRYHSLGHSTRWFFRALSHAISCLVSPMRVNSTTTFATLCTTDIASALASAPASIDRGAQLFKGVTVAELLLVISMCSVEKKMGSSGSYNFHMAHSELMSLFSLEDDFGAASGMQYRYDKKVFYKAFEHLIMLGVVQPVGQHVSHRFLSSSSLLASRDAQPSDCILGEQALRVVLPRRQVQELIREIDREKTIPTIVTRWTGKWL